MNLTNIANHLLWIKEQFELSVFGIVRVNCNPFIKTYGTNSVFIGIFQALYRTIDYSIVGWKNNYRNLFRIDSNGDLSLNARLSAPESIYRVCRIKGIDFQGRLLSKLFCFLSEKGCTIKGMNLVPRGSKFFPFRVHNFSKELGL